MSPREGRSAGGERLGQWWAVTINSADTSRLARFWSVVLGVPTEEAGPDRPGWLRLRPSGASPPFLNFQPVEQPSEAPLKLHLDIYVTDVEAGAARVTELGGVDTGFRQTLPRGHIAVMRDPDGNEFCLLSPPSPREGETGAVDSSAGAR